MLAIWLCCKSFKLVHDRVVISLSIKGSVAGTRVIRARSNVLYNL